MILNCGAEMVAVFIIVPCSAVLVVPICRHRCFRGSCGEALGTDGGLEGSDTVVVVWLVPEAAEVVAGMVGWAQRCLHLWMAIVGRCPLDNRVGL